MSTLGALHPQPLWRLFETLCSIPHPSKHEQALSSWIVDWAQARGIAVTRDDAGNLLLKKPATPGREALKGVVLQAHLDMVPQKNGDNPHDFLTDPIRPQVAGDWVAAEGTTLGADNGIGMASALAVLAADDIAHGPLEVLLTVDEEAGMTGAFALAPGWLEGEILINTDSEQEGEVYMGCAGGVDANAALALDWQPAAADRRGYRLAIRGLKGGHSGCDIHRGRGNAVRLLARVLQEGVERCELRLVDLEGGSLRNAIPREAQARLLVPAARVEALQALVTECGRRFADELGAVEPDLVLALEAEEAAPRMMADGVQRRLLNVLMACPNGVMRMSDAIAGVVETSLNLGVVRTEAERVTVQCLIRSLRDSGREELERRLASLFQLAGMTVTFTGAYPGWQPDLASPVMQLVRDCYRQQFGTLPEVMVIHAGLECGLFKSAYPHWDMVSIGPTIRFPHSPDERVQIDSVARYWQLLVAVLEGIPRRD